MRRVSPVVLWVLVEVALAGLLAGCGDKGKAADPAVHAVCSALHDERWADLSLMADMLDPHSTLFQAGGWVATYGHVSEGGLASDLGLFSLAADEQEEGARASDALNRAWVTCSKEDPGFPDGRGARYDSIRAIVLDGAHSLHN